MIYKCETLGNNAITSVDWKQFATLLQKATCLFLRKSKTPAKKKVTVPQTFSQTLAKHELIATQLPFHYRSQLLKTLQVCRLSLL